MLVKFHLKIIFKYFLILKKVSLMWSMLKLYKSLSQHHLQV